MNFIKLILPLLFVSLTFAKPQSLECSKNPAAKTIACNISDWGANFVQLQTNENCFISCANNDSILSLCFISTDKDLNRQIMMSGFNMNFKGQQKRKSAVLGVTFPIGMHSARPSGENSHDPDALKALENQMMQSLVIIGPDSKSSYPMSHTVAASYDVRATCSYSNDSLIYKLNIPLKKGTSVTDSINLILKSAIHLTISTIESTPPQGNQPAPNGNHPGGSGGPPPSGMGGNNGPPHGPPDGRGSMPPRIEQFSADFLIKTVSQ